MYYRIVIVFDTGYTFVIQINNWRSLSMSQKIGDSCINLDLTNVKYQKQLIIMVSVFGT